MQAGLCVHVPCKVSYPREGWNDSTPAFGYWYQKREAIEDVLVATNNQGKKIARKVRPPSPLDLSGDPGAGDCSLSLSAARPGHSGKYYFRLERGPVNHTYWDNPLTVTVTGMERSQEWTTGLGSSSGLGCTHGVPSLSPALTQTPDIRAKEPLEAGRLGHLVCSLPGACAPLPASTFSWAGAAALRTRVLGSLAAKSPDIVFKPRPQDHGTNLTCQLTFPGADVSRTITLNVSCESGQDTGWGVSGGVRAAGRTQTLVSPLPISVCPEGGGGGLGKGLCSSLCPSVQMHHRT